MYMSMNNNAPEKIYLQPLENDEIYNHWYSSKLTKEFIEYTRTDAFIEKAKKWLNNFYNEETRSYLIAEDIEKFKNYMKGE